MLWLRADHLRKLVVLAESAAPEEACALLIGRRGLGDDWRVSRVEASANVAANRARRFEVDPGLRIGLERELRGSEQTVLGVWHSHTNGSPEPSAEDAARVYEPELVWLITAVADGEAVHTAAWAPVPDVSGARFRPVELRLLRENR